VRRKAAWLLCALDALLFVVAMAALAIGGGGGELSGLAHITVTILFLLTAIPALLLTYYRRAPDLALAFALAFPATIGLIGLLFAA
jgi:hypothetical protein